MAPVQTVYTGPRGLLGSQAHLEEAISQSMCRTLDRQTGLERSGCVGCKMPCIDIDAEKTYWTELNRPGRRLVQYGYLGMVIAFYLYYFLYAGNWDYYFTGAWTHEADVTSKVFDIGFFIYDQAIPIPKFIASDKNVVGISGQQVINITVTPPDLQYEYWVAPTSTGNGSGSDALNYMSIATFTAINSFPASQIDLASARRQLRIASLLGPDGWKRNKLLRLAWCGR
jgi:hypothetical protein